MTGARLVFLFSKAVYQRYAAFLYVCVGVRSDGYVIIIPTHERTIPMNAMHSFASQIPADVLTLIARLQKAGYAAYLVGGCVRDLLLGGTPSDFDIATEALPDEVLSVFSDRACLTVGKAFGTVIVPYSGGHAEVTTFREESGYSDGRRPDQVTYTTDLMQDLGRRDFTMNAMAWRPAGGILDPFGGRKDLAAGVLRTVGSATRRLEEDALRMLRGVRFAARFSLAPAPEFLQAARTSAKKLENISPERVQEEMERMLVGPRPATALRLMESIGALDVLFPELAAMVDFPQDTPFHHLDLMEHSLCVLEKVPAEIDLRWAALLHDTGKVETKFFDERGYARFFGHDKVSEQIAANLLQRLRVSRERMENVTALVRHHMANTNPYTKKSIKKLLGKHSVERMEQLFCLQEADCACASNQGAGNVLEGRALLQEVLEEKEPYAVHQLAISGRDLLDAGIPQSPEIGRWLAVALEWVEEHPEWNVREILLEKIQAKRRNE